MNKTHYALTVLGLVASWKSMAFEYFLEPKFAFNQRYDTNLLLQPTPRHGNWVSTLSPGIDLGFRHENNELTTNFTWNQLFYNNEPELDFDEQLLSTDFKHLGERFTWRFNGQYNNRSSLNTEASTSGILNVQLRRQEFYVAPSVTYKIDDKNDLSLEYSYSDISFEKRPNTNTSLIDYSFHSIGLIFSHFYTEQDRLSLIFSSSIFESPGQSISSSSLLNPIDIIPPAQFVLSRRIKQNTLSHTLQIGWQHTFSEQFVASVNAGARYTEDEPETISKGIDVSTFTEFPPITTTKQSSGFGQVWNVSLQKAFERGTLSFNASQQLSPTAQGNQQQTFIGIIGGYDISDRWNAGLNGNYYTYELPTQQQSTVNRTFYDITPSLTWKWTPEVNLRLSYTYRQLIFDTTDSTSTGNIAQFQITYQPQINRQVK